MYLILWLLSANDTVSRVLVRELWPVSHAQSHVMRDPSTDLSVLRLQIVKMALDASIECMIGLKDPIYRTALVEAFKGKLSSLL
jgi:hypothetical protein